MSVRTIEQRARQSEPILALAEWARANTECVESTIMGDSMVPALAAGTRINIDLRDRDYREGTIVAVLSGSTIIAHRLIGRGRGRRARTYWITRGDANPIPDAPISVAVVLGCVRFADGTEPPAERPRAALERYFAMIVAVALEIDVRVARAITRCAATIQAISRALIRRNRREESAGESRRS